MAALLEHQSERSILLRLDRGGETRLTSRSSGLTRAAILCATGSPRGSVGRIWTRGGIPKATSVRRDSCVLSCRQSFNNERLSYRFCCAGLVSLSIQTS